jgi:hypothetical protein
MIGMPILDVAIGLSFIYLLLALICSAVNETIAGLTQRRADMLKDGLARLLHDTGLRDRLYQHPLIRGLGAEDAKPPSYIPAHTFALALMDTMRATGDLRSQDTATFRKTVASAGNEDFQRAFHAVVGEAPEMRKALSPDGTTSDAAPDLKRIEAWYDSHMDRVSGWYKRKTQTWVFGLALAITVVTNAGTVRMTRTLWQNPTVRSAVVEAARARAQMERPEEMLPLVTYPNPDQPTAGKPIRVQKDQALTDQERAVLGQLLGWSLDLGSRPHQPGPLAWWLMTHLIGWLLTAVAISQGAPFWFDTLNRFITIRNAGRPPDERRDKSQPTSGAQPS